MQPVFGDLFLNEPVPHGGKLQVSVLDKPGFGLELNPKAQLLPANSVLFPSQGKEITATLEKEKEN